MKLELNDLQCWDHMYYVGHLIDLDGDGWVNVETAIGILKTINQ